MAFRVGIQAASLVVLARMFGPADYGLLSALVALAGILTPFSGLGLEAILIRDVARAPENFRVSWGQTLGVIAITGTLLSLFLLGIASLVLPPTLSPALIIIIAFADLVLGKLVDSSAKAFQAQNCAAIAAWIPSLTALVRLTGLLLLWISPKTPTLMDWAVIYWIGSLLPSAALILFLSRRFGGPKWSSMGLNAAIRSGGYFSLNTSADRTNNELDKVLLAHLSQAEVAGYYALAYRCLTMACVPIHALLLSTYANFFVHGTQGLSATWNYARRLLPRAFVMTLWLALILLVAAPLLPIVFGGDFAESAFVLQYLPLVMPLLLLRYLAGHVLGGCGYERHRAIALIIAATLNFALNIWMIPLYGWKASLIATLTSELWLCISLYSIIFYFMHNEPTCNVAT
ncbi:MAG: oligosaccharide flippase family protein [Gammaproteobacteria bacterium]|nr:oligosaccharide flippase family protein [Gammaproteobacteria bacterium]